MANSITTHVLDTARGKPAAGVPVALELRDGLGRWELIGQGVTDADGRLRTLTAEGGASCAGSIASRSTRGHTSVR